MFNDRTEAGIQLSEKLEGYRKSDAVVLAIPRGGVEVGYEIAKNLNLYLSMLICRKLPYPGNPESGFGAIAEDGSTFIIKRAADALSRDTISKVKTIQRKEIRRRVSELRKDRPFPDIEGRTVILTDDGVAMGSTMSAAIEMCRNCNAEKVVVAVPVIGKAIEKDIRELSDELFAVETPVLFQAVAQVYHNWYDVPDEEVIEIMDNYRKEFSHA